ncbi:FG-GAP-like repeat-containing protein [Streptomyces sp. NPDC054841]
MRTTKPPRHAAVGLLTATALAGGLLAGVTGTAQAAAVATPRAAAPATPSWLIPLSFAGNGTTRACTGIVLSATRTLAAPDCFTGRSDTDFAYDYNLATGQIESGTNRPDYRTHPQFDATTRQAGVGVLIDSHVDPSRYGKPVLAGSADTVLYAAGKPATFYSWAAPAGASEQRVKHTEQVVVRRGADCAAALGLGSSLPPGMICTSAAPGTPTPDPKEQCTGDSGGALVAGGKLVAFSATGAAACVRDGFRLYTAVPTYRPVIEGWTRDVDLDHWTTGSVLGREPGPGIFDLLQSGPYTKDPVNGTGQLFEDEYNLLLQAGDFNRNGYADLLGRTPGGTLYRIPVGENLEPGTRVSLGTGWSRYNRLFAVRDLSGDGQPDVVGRDASGYLWMHPGTGSGGVGARVKIGVGWGQFTVITGRGDLSGDARPDLLARDGKGDLWLYPGNGRGGFLPRIKAGAGWNSFNTVVASGDFDRDGRQDVIARTSWGAAYLYNANHAGSFFGAKQITDKYWKRYTYLS